MTIFDKEQCKLKIKVTRSWEAEKTLRRKNLSAEHGDAVFKRQRRVQNEMSVV